MLKLVRYLKEFRKQVIIGPLFKLTEAIFELIVPLLMAKIIDDGVARGDLPYVLKTGAVIVLLGLVGLGCALICQYSAARAPRGWAPGCATTSLPMWAPCPTPRSTSWAPRPSSTASAAMSTSCRWR